MVSADQVLKVPNDIDPEYAACLAVNPSTALRLLKDFAALKPGDVLIQNGANSMVGQCVIQLAKLHGIRTINVLRKRYACVRLCAPVVVVSNHIVVFI